MTRHPDIDRSIELVVIGCSSGGVEALRQLLPAFPASLGLSVVVVIHLAPGSPGLLPGLFAGQCALGVKEAEDKEAIAPGRVYFAPSGYHLLVEPDRSFSLSVEEPVNFSRPSIDVLFESAAAAYGRRLLGIVLTGANRDGADGLREVIARGGYGMVQDPESAEWREMPQSARETSSPQRVLDLPRLKTWISQLREEPATCAP